MRVSRLGARLRFASCAAALVAAPAALSAQDEPLTMDEVLDLRRRGVSTRQILRSAREYCIAFTVTDSAARALAEFGPDTALIGGLRAACVVAPPAQLAPGVLADDDFKAMAALARFVSADRLCTARADSAGLRVENRRLRGGCAIGYPLDLGSSDVRIELTLAQLGGNGSVTAALGFGRDPASWDQYAFAITPGQEFELCLSVAGQCRRLLFQRRVAALRVGPSAENRVAVEIRGREIVLYINDERVGAHQADGPVVGGISLGVGARTSAIFTRLRAQRIGGVASTR